MARRPVEDWATLGGLIVEVWRGSITLTNENIRKELTDRGVALKPEDWVEVHGDTDHLVNVTIPKNPGYTADELNALSEEYKKELGIVIMGGCR